MHARTGKSILEYVDFIQAAASRRISPDVKTDREQYFSSAPLARLMASMLEMKQANVSILDPGAGVGILFAACIDALLQREALPQKISIAAYEIDHSLMEDLGEVMRICKEACERRGVKFEGEVLEKDFIVDTAEKLGLSQSDEKRFNCVIMNPPYAKLSNSSAKYRLLKAVGLESPNYYTAFMDMAVKLLDEGGEMVSITPRSFCNGLYFKPFRKRFLETLGIERIHLFTSRTDSFREDSVLQENVILHSVKGRHPGTIVISSSEGPGDEGISIREMKADKVVAPGDPEFFVRIVSDEIEQQLSEKMKLLKMTLKKLGLEVSTGKVVDFRSRASLFYEPKSGTVPLIHPTNLNTGGFVVWPINEMRKPGYIKVEDDTKPLLVRKGNYVLVKRFTTNEEKKRIVAAVYDCGRLPAELVGFENRVNYFHSDGNGIDLELAKGLAVFLNSTMADSYFRQMSGHTQVNSTDLRNFGYPTEQQLRALGSQVSNVFPGQKQIDEMVEKELFGVSTGDKIDPIAAKGKIEDALSVLKQLDLPREQQNERSALTLLALLDIKPKDAWSGAKTPLCGITPMMEFFETHYGKHYAPNTRETVRRFTIHQFLQAGLVVANPDDEDRPTNSPKAVYQIEAKALEVLKTFGTDAWEKNLGEYRASVKSLREKYAMERDRRLIPVKIGDTQTIHLSPGGQNVLIQKIIDLFAPEFVPHGRVIYVGDTGEKFAYFDTKTLASLGVKVEPHGKMPDVIIYDSKRNWLLLIEAVTSHGPISPKRREELKRIFSKSTAGIVYVTAFLDRATMVSYLRDISWETEVWVADAPTHMIHFNGERFLGPYET